MILDDNPLATLSLRARPSPCASTHTPATVSASAVAFADAGCAAFACTSNGGACASPTSCACASASAGQHLYVLPRCVRTRLCLCCLISCPRLCPRLRELPHLHLYLHRQRLRPCPRLQPRLQWSHAACRISISILFCLCGQHSALYDTGESGRERERARYTWVSTTLCWEVYC